MSRESLKTVSRLLAGVGLVFLSSSLGCGQGSSGRSGGASGGSTTGQGGSAGAGSVAPLVGGGGVGGLVASGGTPSSTGNGGGLAGASGTAGAGPVAGATVVGGGAGAISSSGTAGSPGSGGSGGSAGGAGSGGISASGGSVTTTSTAVTGGAGNTGSTSRAGGTTTTGGATATGGTATTGGTTAIGGSTVAGGSTATGGTTRTGGSTATGGTTRTGGTTAAGGATGTGGTTSTGGGTGASGTPVLVSTINLKTSGGCPGLRLGDINGDGKMEIVVGQPEVQPGAYTPQLVVCVTAYDLKGNQLWQYGTPGTNHVASSDVPLQVYDMDGDGKSEVFANMSTTEMTVLDGTTGKLLRKIPLPQAGSNDSIAFANLRGKAWPQDIIVKTRYSQFWAITGIDDATTKAGTLLWNKKLLANDTSLSDFGTGHYPLAYDWDGDGKDEVMGGYFFFESDGTQQWTLNTTSSPKLTMHADSIATGDMDGNPANGYEIVVNGNVAAAFDWKTGKQLWQDTNTIEAQQIGMGDYRPDLPGLEVVLLDRLRTAAEGFKSNNVLVDRNDKLLWKENRPTNSGWLTVTENMNNWDGKGSDVIFSYRRDGKSDGSGGTGTYLYDGYGKTVASFPYSGASVQTFAQHADLCGDGKEEVITYDETTLRIYANGGCNLDDTPAHPGIPQQYHLYNWSIYTGWITPDVKFYTPGTPQ